VVREDGPTTWSGEYASPSRQTEETKKRFLTPFSVPLQVGDSRSAAYAEVNIPGLPDEVVSFSGGQGRGGLEAKWVQNNPGSQIAKPTSRTGPGRQDAEVKILDDLRTRLNENPNLSGTVRMFVDQPQGKGVCEFCTDAIMQFSRDFLGRVELIVSAN